MSTLYLNHSEGVEAAPAAGGGICHGGWRSDLHWPPICKDCWTARPGPSGCGNTDAKVLPRHRRGNRRPSLARDCGRVRGSCFLRDAAVLLHDHTCAEGLGERYDQALTTLSARVGGQPVGYVEPFGFRGLGMDEWGCGKHGARASVPIKGAAERGGPPADILDGNRTCDTMGT